MAKGLRASSRKKNNQALRAKIFGPAADARTERLSAKLQELAAKPKPERERAVEVDDTEQAGGKYEGKDMIAGATGDAMDVDTRGSSRKFAKKRKGVKSGRIEKTSRRKPKNLISFPDIKAKWRRLSETKKRR